MSPPVIRNGKFHAGQHLRCGENVVIDVSEEVVIGDRCTLPDNAYLSGRRITIGDDFYGMGWGHPAPDPAYLRDHDSPTGSWLEIGRGRRDEEDAVLMVGNRCTFHDNRIDLSRCIDIGDDVGLSPAVVIYTHHYWLSPCHGYPCRYDTVAIGSGSIIGFRSVVLPGTRLGRATVIGAQSVVSGYLIGNRTYGGNPIRLIKRSIAEMTLGQKHVFLHDLMNNYRRSLEYRGYHEVMSSLFTDFPVVHFQGCVFNLETFERNGEENDYTDDLRDYLFKHGFRFYTNRPFHKLGRSLSELPV